MSTEQEIGVSSWLALASSVILAEPGSLLYLSFNGFCTALRSMTLLRISTTEIPMYVKPLAATRSPRDGLCVWRARGNHHRTRRNVPDDLSPEIEKGPPSAGAPDNRLSPDSALQQERLRVFDQLLYTDQKADGLGAVYDAVVVGEGEVHHGADLDLAVDDHRPLLNLVHPKDGDLGQGQDGRREQAPEDPAVGDRKGTSGQVFEGELALAGLGGEVRDAALYLGEALAVGVAHDGDDEPLLGRDGDAYVVVVLEDELVALELRVDLRERLEGADGGLGEEAHEAEAGARTLLEGVLAPFSQGHYRAHVRLVKGGEHRGRLLRFDESLGDRLAAARDPHPLLEVGPAVLGARLRRLLGLAVRLRFGGLLGSPGALGPDQALHVLARDAPARAGSGDLGQLYPVLLCQLAHGGRGATAAVLPVPVLLAGGPGLLFSLGLRLLLGGFGLFLLVLF